MLRLKVILINIVAALASIPGIAFCTETGMRFLLFEPCSGNGSFCGTRILAQGIIESDTPERFKSFLESAKRNKLKNIDSVTVALDSPGGDLAAGVRLGRIFRNHKIETELAPEYSRILWNKPSMSDRSETFVQKARCASACTLAFIGGVQRKVEEKSRFGVHQFSVPNGQAGDSRTQIAIVELSEYLQEMGIDRRMLDRASVIPPTSIDWLSKAEIEQLRIDNTGYPLQPWIISASEQGEPNLSLRQAVSAGTDVYVLVKKVLKDRIAIRVRVCFDSAVHLDKRVALFPVSESGYGFGILANGEFLGLDREMPWVRDNQRDGTCFSSVVLTSNAEAMLLRRASTVKLVDSFPNSIGDLRFSSFLSIQGLNSGIALIMR
jgi:hypothetical protein